MKEYIAYQGESYTVEWYYDNNYKSQALNYYKTLSQQERVKVLRLFKRMGDVGKIKDKTKFNYEGEQIYTFKPMPDRFLCFFYQNKKIILTNAFRKKQQKMSLEEKSKALRNRNDYILRIERGDYYAKNQENNIYI